MTSVSHVVQMYNQPQVLACSVLLYFLMTDWGKGLYTVALQGLGSFIDR